MPNYTVQATMKTFLYLENVSAPSEDAALQTLLNKVSNLVSEAPESDNINISDFLIDNVHVSETTPLNTPASASNYVSINSLLNSSNIPEETTPSGPEGYNKLY